MDNEHSILNEDDDLTEVLEELHGTEAKWKSIGIHLKLPLSCLEEIGKEYKGDTEECSLQMQIAWLRGKKATWKSLIEVLRKSSVGYEDKARDIEKRRLSNGNSGRRKDSQNQSRPPADVFLIEHLEWLLKIGCSVDKILKWAREKQQNQAVTTPSHFNSHNGIDASSSIPRSECTDLVHGRLNPQQASGLGNSSGHSSAKTKQRKRQQLDKSWKPRPKKSRKKDASPVRFVLINTLQGTKRERQLQLKHNMLQIIKKLKRDPDGAEFINFVDECQAKGYYDIIKYPMCLQEIEDRINRHQCDSCEVFCEEFDFIVDNCVKYNGADSPSTEKVQRLNVQFYKLVQTYLTTDTSASASSPLAVVEGEHLNSENSSSDEKYNPTAESQSTYNYDMGDSDILEPSPAEELPHDWKRNSDGDTTIHSPDTKTSEMSGFKSSVKVKNVHNCDPTGGSTQMVSTDEDSDSELPPISWNN